MLITSILDNDLYCLTQQQATLELYPDAVATFRFVNRRLEDRFTEEFVQKLQKAVEGMANLSLDIDELEWLNATCPFLKQTYLQYLSNYRFNPKEVSIRWTDGALSIDIHGPWHRTILWEVPLMATISELYFAPSGPDKGGSGDWDYLGQEDLAAEKALILGNAGCIYGDFGTRRRRSWNSQNTLVRILKGNPGFVGTSNVRFAMSHGVKPMGTMSHQWIQAHSVSHGLRHANRYALEAWVKVYRSELGIALPDTYGSESFFKDFDAYLARLYDGVRHDSGCPFTFADRMVEHYDFLRVPPQNKTILFSDSLTAKKSVAIKKHCEPLGVGTAYGIGTHFTNDYKGPKKPLNMVIKLVGMNGVPVVKLSDDRGKEIGDPDALRVARWTFSGTPLDFKQTQE